MKGRGRRAQSRKTGQSLISPCRPWWGGCRKTAEKILQWRIIHTFLYYFYIFTCTCVRVYSECMCAGSYGCAYVQTGACIHVYAHACEATECLPIPICTFVFWDRVLSLNLEPTNWPTWLASKIWETVPLYLLPTLAIGLQTPFHGYRTWTQVLMLARQALYNWAISPSPTLFWRLILWWEMEPSGRLLALYKRSWTQPPELIENLKKDYYTEGKEMPILRWAGTKGTFATVREKSCKGVTVRPPSFPARRLSLNLICH